MNITKELAQEMKDIWRYRYVVFSFVQTKLKQRYRRSFLGFLWTILAPLAHYVIIAYMMTLIGKNSIPNYFVYMFTGSVVFSVISNTLSGAPHYLISNEHFIKKIYLPKSLFVLNSVFLEMTNFLLTSLALFAFGLLTCSIHFSWALCFVPFALFFAMLMLIGIGALISVCAVYFRDLIHIIPVVMQALFFLTPILYSPEILPQEYRHIVALNPLTYLIECFRTPIISGTFPQTSQIFWLVIIATALGLAGLICLKKFDNKIVFRM